MLAISNFELDWIAAFQGTGSWQEWMLWFSYLGSEALPFLIAFVYFVVSKRQGQRLYVLFAASAALLHVFKLAFHLPRPFWVDSRIKALTGSGGYGLPSGHVLGATVGWLFLGRILRTRWVWYFSIACVLLVSISRLYLGVHFIRDVVAAWLIGIALIWGFESLDSKVTKWLSRLSFAAQIGVVIWAASLLLSIGLCMHAMAGQAGDPPDWRSFSANARDLRGFFRSAGELFGAAAGISMASRWAAFVLSPALWKRAGAFGYALAGAWLIRKAFEFLPVPNGEAAQQLIKFAAGAAGNFWMLFIAPCILLRIGLLSRDCRKKDSDSLLTGLAEHRRSGGAARPQT